MNNILCALGLTIVSAVGGGCAGTRNAWAPQQRWEMSHPERAEIKILGLVAKR